MLLGSTRPVRIEYLHDTALLKTVDFPLDRAKTFGECMAAAREAIQACWGKSDGVMHLRRSGAEPHYNLVRVVAANSREICRSVADEQRHG